MPEDVYAKCKEGEPIRYGRAIVFDGPVPSGRDTAHTQTYTDIPLGSRLDNRFNHPTYYTGGQ